MNRFRTILLVITGTAVVLSACGTGSTGTDKAAGPGSAKAFVLSEWSITPPSAPLQSGRMQITATNRGHETHELVIVRASDAGSLPTKADGSVDEDRIQDADKAGEIPDVAAGKSVTKTLDLPAGRYVAVCNLVEQMGSGMGGMGTGGTGNGSAMGQHVHYHLGMVTQFTVT